MNYCLSGDIAADGVRPLIRRVKERRGTGMPLSGNTGRGHSSAVLNRAFQPKRVMVPSLPLRFLCPAIPSFALVCALAFLLARMVESSMDSIKPLPKMGVGTRKITLLRLHCGARTERPKP